MRRRHRALVVAVYALAATFIPNEAYAHDAAVYSPRIWNENNDHRIRYYIEPSIPGSWDQRLFSAANNWNVLTGNFDFELEFGGHANYANDCGLPNTTNRNPILLIHLSNNPRAQTAVCYDEVNGDIDTYAMMFDSDETWYSGSSEPPEGQLDVSSVAVHEFGHAFGFGTNPSGFYGHFFGSDSAACPASFATRSTMCNYNADMYDDKYGRSLEFHDEHVNNDAYDTNGP